MEAKDQHKIDCCTMKRSTLCKCVEHSRIAREHAISQLAFLPHVGREERFPFSSHRDNDVGS